MATLISDLYGADPSPFHHTRGPSDIAARLQQQPQQQQQTQHHQHQHSQHHHLHRDSMQCPIPSSASNQSTAAPHPYPQKTPDSPPLSSSNSFSSPSRSHPATSSGPGTGSASLRMPTPPDSSLPSSPQQSRDAAAAPTAPAPATTTTSMVADAAMPSASSTPVAASNASVASSTSTASTSGTVVPAYGAARPPPATNAIPSPASDRTAYQSGLPSSALPSATALPPPPPPRVQRTIMIQDLNHIQSLTQADPIAARDGRADSIVLTDGDTPLQDVKFEISAMPIADIIEMVAALLTKITTTNDHQHDALHRNASHSRQAQAHNGGVADGRGSGSNGGGGGGSAGSSGSSSSSGSPFSSSVLAFHGKNVPAITILSYLSRIHKYCPTTYEVFLSLLVYFDRMTERVNDLVMKQQKEREARQDGRETGAGTAAAASPPDDVAMQGSQDAVDDGDETNEALADSDSDSNSGRGGGGGAAPAETSRPGPSTDSQHQQPPAGRTPVSPLDPASLSATYFVVDSYNIHRLIIAGVTCASKFFSDVFYTNARYAKVGGLPLAELNHLELQFLILNDFRLAIPIEDLEAYATMLVEFYAREVVGRRPRPSAAATATATAATTTASAS